VTRDRLPSPDRPAYTAFPVCGRFVLCDVELAVACHTLDQLARLTQLWQQLFALHQLELEASGSRPHIRFTFGPGALTEPHLAMGEDVFRSSSLRIRLTARGFFLECHGASINVDLVADHAEGVLVDGLWSAPVEDQREFFLLSLTMLLHARGGYALHANGLVCDGEGYLVVADSGSGKTTLTLALVQAGWSYLSDDAIVLQDSPDGIAALAFRRGFSCPPEFLAKHPWLQTPAQQARAVRGSKTLIDAEQAFPGRCRPRTMPRVLLFPSIADQDQSSLAPLDSTHAMIALMQQSAGLLTDRVAAALQMGVLARLVQQTRSYRLLLGRDVYHHPDAVAAMLARAGKA
jgi:hypothetical protein